MRGTEVERIARDVLTNPVIRRSVIPTGLEEQVEPV